MGKSMSKKEVEVYSEKYDIHGVVKFWCDGNHDVSYLWEAMESGYSYYVRDTVVNRIRDLRNSIPPEKRETFSTND